MGDDWCRTFIGNALKGKIADNAAYALRGLEDGVGWIGGLGSAARGTSHQMNRGYQRVIGGGIAGLGLTGTALYMHHRSSARDGLQGRSSGGY